MALPEQIRKQTEAVQELYKQINGDDNNGEGQQPPADGNASSTEQHQTADENSAPNDATQSSTNEQTVDDEKGSEDNTVIQKYKTLQGMYNAEVPRLHSQNKELQSRLQSMEQLLATMSAQQSNRNNQVADVPLITDRDQEE